MYVYAVMYVYAYVCVLVCVCQCVSVLQGSASPEEHGLYVWTHFVSQAKAQNIVIVAHSYGGIVTCTIVSVKRSKLMFDIR